MARLTALKDMSVAPFLSKRRLTGYLLKSRKKTFFLNFSRERYWRLLLLFDKNGAADMSFSAVSLDKFCIVKFMRYGSETVLYPTFIVDT